MVRHRHRGFRPTARAATALARLAKRGEKSAFLNEAVALLADFLERSSPVELLVLRTEAERRNLTLGAYLADLAAPTARKLLVSGKKKPLRSVRANAGS